MKSGYNLRKIERCCVKGVGEFRQMDNIVTSFIVGIIIKKYKNISLSERDVQK